MRFPIGVAAAIAFSGFVSTASAQSGIQVGVLNCRGVSSQYVLSSVTQLSCTFSSAAGADSYVATINRVGLDIGINQATVLSWLVIAPTARVGRGSLAGVYVGVSANATVGLGVGANVLLGGSANTFALQPVSVQGQAGLGAAAGVSALQLQAVQARRR